MTATSIIVERPERKTTNAESGKTIQIISLTQTLYDLVYVVSALDFTHPTSNGT